jgi:hypothetical protein
MVELHTIIDLLTPLSITVGVIYYVMVLQNQNKTRQIQLLMQLTSDYTVESSRVGHELMYMEWDDYEDFERKYGSDNNPDNFAKRMYSWNRFNTQGMLLMNGLVNRDLLFGTGRTGVMFHWKKFGEVIKEIRRRYAMPLYGIGFEYMAVEYKKYLEQKGYEIEVPDTLWTFVPDK